MTELFRCQMEHSAWHVANGYGRCTVQCPSCEIADGKREPSPYSQAICDQEGRPVDSIATELTAEAEVDVEPETVHMGAVISIHLLREAVAFLRVCLRSGEQAGADHPMVMRALERADAFTDATEEICDQCGQERSIVASRDVCRDCVARDRKLDSAQEELYEAVLAHSVSSADRRTWLREERAAASRGSSTAMMRISAELKRIRRLHAAELDRFRRSRFYLDGDWRRAREFPFLRAVSLWLTDYAPVGPGFGKAEYSWLDVADPLVGRLGCARHGHEWMMTGNGPPPECRWCSKPMPAWEPEG